MKADGSLSYSQPPPLAPNLSQMNPVHNTLLLLGMKKRKLNPAYKKYLAF